MVYQRRIGNIEKELHSAPVTRITPQATAPDKGALANVAIAHGIGQPVAQVFIEHGRHVFDAMNRM